MAPQESSAVAASRMLICTLFLASAISKIQNFNQHTGGPAMSWFGPKVDTLISTINSLTKLDVTVNRAVYPNLLLTYSVVEFLGAVLFAADILFGGQLLIAVLVLQCVLLHNFWDYADNAAAWKNELSHFLKNVAIMGGLLYYLLTSPGAKYRSKYDRMMDQLKVEGPARTTAVGAASSAAPALSDVTKDKES